MIRTARLLAIAALLAALGTRAGATARAVCTADGVLPAGLWFRELGSYAGNLDATAQCPRATAAVILGVFPTGAATRARLRELPAAALTPGYPWAVHTDELGLAAPHADGVALVAGLFASEAAAKRWLDDAMKGPAGKALAGATVVALADDKTARAAVTPAHERHVVQLDAAGTVDAYRKEDVRGLVSPDWTGGVLPASARRALASLKPACSVQGDDVFVTTEWHPVDVNGMAWAPVQCGTTTAYVPRDQTRVESVVWRDKGGAYRLSQVGRVECDTAGLFLEWRYDGAGRRSSLRQIKTGRHCG